MTRRRDDPAVKRDMACVHAALEMQVEEQLASPTGRIPDGEVEPFLVLKHDGAVERLMQLALREICLVKGTDAEREALLFWLKYFQIYLDLHLPKTARDLYVGPLTYLALALADLDRGLVRPVFERTPISNRPTDGHIEANFRVACVLAADEVYASGRPPGRKRSMVSRTEADARIFWRVRKTAAALGFCTMSEKTIDGWRKAIKKAPADDPLTVSYRFHKHVVKDVRAIRGSDAVVDWYLGRITDAEYIA